MNQLDLYVSFLDALRAQGIDVDRMSEREMLEHLDSFIGGMRADIMTREREGLMADDRALFDVTVDYKGSLPGERGRVTVGVYGNAQDVMPLLKKRFMDPKVIAIVRHENPLLITKGTYD